MKIEVGDSNQQKTVLEIAQNSVARLLAGTTPDSTTAKMSDMLFASSKSITISGLWRLGCIDSRVNDNITAGNLIGIILDNKNLREATCYIQICTVPGHILKKLSDRTPISSNATPYDFKPDFADDDYDDDDIYIPTASASTIPDGYYNGMDTGLARLRGVEERAALASNLTDAQNNGNTSAPSQWIDVPPSSSSSMNKENA
jgi:hypothetical protein